MNVVILVAVVAVCAFAIGYAFGSAPLQKELGRKLEPQEEVSANVRLILDADRARKEAAAAHLLLEIAMARNAELVEEIMCLKSRL